MKKRTSLHKKPSPRQRSHDRSEQRESLRPPPPAQSTQGLITFRRLVQWMSRACRRLVDPGRGRARSDRTRPLTHPANCVSPNATTTPASALTIATVISASSHRINCPRPQPSFHTLPLPLNAAWIIQLPHPPCAVQGTLTRGCRAANAASIASLIAPWSGGLVLSICPAGCQARAGPSSRQ